MPYIGNVSGFDDVDTEQIKDDAVTADKLANSINTEIAASTSKLSGIETAATADQTNAEIKTAVEAATSIALGGSPTTTTQSQADNSTKLATTAYTDVAIAALADSAPGTLNTLNELAAALGDDASFSTTVTNSIATKLPLAGGTMTGDTLHGDNVKAKFGASGDLQIYHSGATSWIRDLGTGDLVIDTDGGNIALKGAGPTSTMARFFKGGSVDLYHDGNEKLATTSTGIDVTGTVTADGLVVDGVSTLNNHVKIANGYSLGWGDISTRVTGNATADTIQVYTDAKKRANIAANGDISFYEDTGTTAKFFWDASAESLGIGTSSPAYPLEVQSGGVGTVLRAGTTNVSIDSTGSAASPSLIFNGDSDSGLWHPTSNTLAVSTAGSERMRVDASGNLLVGTANTLPAINNVEGIALSAGSFGGRFEVSRSNNEPVAFNRMASDGSILSFKKDGTTVGSIGTKSGKLFIGNGNANLLFANATDDVVPSTGTGATNDNSIDLGAAGNRFKDLHLSGQVYTGTIVTTGHVKAADGYSIGWGDLTTRFTGNSAGDFITATTAGTERMRIDSAGNVGIGTSTVTAGFKAEVIGDIRVADVVGDDAVEMGWSAGSGSGFVQAYDRSASVFRNLTLNNAMTIANSGNVGIGVVPQTNWASAFEVLQIGQAGAVWANNNDNSTRLAMNVKYDGAYKRINANKAANLTLDSAGSFVFDVAATGAADSAISWTTAMTIDNNGNTRWGAGTGTGDGVDINPGTNYTLRCSKAGVSETDQILFYNANGNVGQIRTSGSSTSYNTSSDYRLKTDVQPMTGATATFMQLKPVNFEWISSGERVDGFLAHELQEVIPAAATGSKDGMMDEEYEVSPAVLDDEGVETTPAVMGTRSVPDMQGIDQSKVVPLLTAALQEAIATIESMEARLQALETAP